MKRQNVSRRAVLKGGGAALAGLDQRPPHDNRASLYAWRFWAFDWGKPARGEHRITSRAFDTDGNMQPAPNDPFVASRRTYWESNGHITRRVSIP